MAVTITVLYQTPGAQATPPRSVTFDQSRVVIGRGPGSDVLLPDTTVSHRHASIRQRGTSYLLVDEGSTNGTFVGNVRLAPHAPRLLGNHERVRVGNIWLDIETTFARPADNDVQVTRDIALAIVGSHLADRGVPSAPRLVVVQGPDRGKEIILTNPPQPIILGRGEQADLPLDLEDASRRHARVLRQGDRLLLRDLGSRNGTYVDGQAVAMDRDTILNPGETFVIAQDVFLFEHPAAERLKELQELDDQLLQKTPEPPPTIPNDQGLTADVQQQAGSSAQDPSSSSESTDDAVPRATSSPSAPRISPSSRTVAKSEEKKGRKWRGVDFVIFGLALLVLGLSFAGLFWLFHSN